MRRLAIFLVGLPLASLVSCAANSPARLTLATPLGPARHIVQRIKAEWPGSSAELICVLELNAQQIAIAGLSVDGLSLFNLRYDGQTLAIERSPLLPANLPPELIVADLQLIYWPAVEIQKTLPAEWRLDITTDRRTLYYYTEKHAETLYLLKENDWPSYVQLQNYSYHYKLTINTLEYDAVPE
jgi:hypothetical protein